MNRIKKILTVFTCFFFLVFFASKSFAEEIKISDVLGTTDTDETTTTEELDQKEEEREDNLLNQLLLTIPEQTDNPSHTITFVDPSEKQSGVQLEIDGTSYKDIKSPYSFPALSIGIHTLKFKFVDKYSTTQILEEEIIIVPRPPIISSPSIVENKLILSGTGLANSEIILILSSNNKMITQESTIDEEGDWHIEIEENIPDGIYTFSAYLRKYGYASDLAESVTATVNNSSLRSNNSDTISNIFFSFDSITKDNWRDTISNNQDLVILIAFSFVIGIILSLIFSSLIRNGIEKREIIKVEKKMDQQNINGKSKTLFEKLSKKEESKVDSPEKVNEKKEERIKEEENKEEKFVTRIDFLKDFKKFDPDNEKGEEIKNEEKNIKVSLTSKS